MSLLVPVTLGIFVKHRWPKVAKKILKVNIDIFFKAYTIILHMSIHQNLVYVCFIVYFSLYIYVFSSVVWLCCGHPSDYHHCCGGWRAVPVLMDNFSFSMDNRSNLPNNRLWPGLFAGSICGAALVQVLQHIPVFFLALWLMFLFKPL